MGLILDNLYWVIVLGLLSSLALSTDGEIMKWAYFSAFLVNGLFYYMFVVSPLVSQKRKKS